MFNLSISKRPGRGANKPHDTRRIRQQKVRDEARRLIDPTMSGWKATDNNAENGQPIFNLVGGGVLLAQCCRDGSSDGLPKWYIRIIDEDFEAVGYFPVVHSGLMEELETRSWSVLSGEKSEPIPFNGEPVPPPEYDDYRDYCIYF